MSDNKIAYRLGLSILFLPLCACVIFLGAFIGIWEAFLECVDSIKRVWSDDYKKKERIIVK